MGETREVDELKIGTCVPRLDERRSLLGEWCVDGTTTSVGGASQTTPLHGMQSAHTSHLAEALDGPRRVHYRWTRRSRAGGEHEPAQLATECTTSETQAGRAKWSQGPQECLVVW